MKPFQTSADDTSSNGQTWADVQAKIERLEREAAAGKILRLEVGAWMNDTIYGSRILKGLLTDYDKATKGGE